MYEELFKVPTLSSQLSEKKLLRQRRLSGTARLLFLVFSQICQVMSEIIDKYLRDYARIAQIFHWTLQLFGYAFSLQTAIILLTSVGNRLSIV